MDEVYKALTDKSRRKILELLKTQDMTPGEINVHFHFSGPTLSHHLDVLKKARLVIADKQGQYVYYSLNTSVFEEVMKQIINLLNK